MLSLLLGLSVAHPCAGLFTSSDSVASSDSQEVIFRLSDDNVVVEYNVRYEGDSDEFGWLIPIFGDFVEFEEGSADLFDDYRAMSGPSFIQEIADDPGCRGCGADKGSNDWADTGLSAGGRGNDAVLAEGYAGDYAWTALEGSNQAAVLTWLSDNGYDTSMQTQSLGAYGAEGVDWVAIRLEPSDPTTGEEGRTLLPIRITYSGDVMRFPAIMSLGGTLDTYRTTVYVEGDTRASLASGWEEEEFGSREAIDTTVDPGTMFDDLLFELGGEERVYATVFAGTTINGTFLTRFDTHALREVHLSDPVFELSPANTDELRSEIIEPATAEAMPLGMLLTLPFIAVGWARRRRDDG